MEATKIIIDIVNDRIMANIVRALATDPDFGVSGTAERGTANLDDILEQLPDIVILSMEDRRRDGLVSTRYLRRHMPSLAVILTVDKMDDQKLLECLKVGAAACVSGTDYMMYGTMWQSVVSAVAEGQEPIIEAVLRPEVATLVLSEFEAPSKLRDLQNNVLTKLLPPETELLLGIAAGNVINNPNTEMTSVVKRLHSIVHKLVMNADVTIILEDYRKLAKR